jgi:DNA-binding SARP family transcriptional activator
MSRCAFVPVTVANGSVSMQFRILGALEVADGDATVALGGVRQRTLLAILVLNANEVVSADRLIDELWGERSPESGRSALQVRVSQLRKALGHGGAQLLTRTPGYVLELDRDQLDLQHFERIHRRRGRTAARPTICRPEVSKAATGALGD